MKILNKTSCDETDSLKKDGIFIFNMKNNMTVVRAKSCQLNGSIQKGH